MQELLDQKAGILSHLQRERPFGKLEKPSLKASNGKFEMQSYSLSLASQVNDCVGSSPTSKSHPNLVFSQSSSQC